MKNYSIYLRPFKDDDYIIINKWRNDIELQRMTVGPIRFVSLGIEKEWVQSKMMNNTKEIYWAICLNDSSQRIIGYTSLNEIDHLNKKACWGGILIGEKDCQDGDLVFEAAILVHEYAFEQLNLNRLYGTHLVDHPFTPSFGLALGWTEEGTLRKAVYKNGKYKDLRYCSFLKEEYERMKLNNEFNKECIIKRFINIYKHRS